MFVQQVKLHIMIRHISHTKHNTHETAGTIKFNSTDLLKLTNEMDSQSNHTEKSEIERKERERERR